MAAGRVAQRRLDEALAARGVTLRHIGALGHLVHRPDMSYSDLGRRAGVTSQSMRATVRHLEGIGAVARTLPGHGHAARLEVTESGRALLAWAASEARAVDAALFADVPADTLAALRQALLPLALPNPPPGQPPPGRPQG
jgi:DNA-binding MarR family transcriptional regulator